MPSVCYPYQRRSEDKRPSTLVEYPSLKTGRIQNVRIMHEKQVKSGASGSDVTCRLRAASDEESWSEADQQAIGSVHLVPR